MEQMEPMEDDFPFTFGDVSDEEAGSDGLFCAPKVKAASSKPKAILDQNPYYAQIDEDGWFHRTGKSVEGLMLQDKNGATKVKMRADHYYMFHQYQEAYDIALEYCRIVANNGANIIAGDSGVGRQDNGAETAGSGVLRVTDSKEMHEMALRCALKLNKLGEAATLADELTIQDTGAVFLKAKAYMAVGRCNDAALKLITTILALLSILRARHLMRASTWSQVDYAQARYDREMKAMSDLRSTLERECGLNLKYVTDQIGRCENGTQEDTESQCMLEEYMQKVVAPAQEILRTMKEAEETEMGHSNSSFALEVVEFIVNSWDPQVLASATPGIIQEDDNEPGEVSVRNK
ncbi:hypothetical protein BGX26_011728 [Mortierella sp. AD094]|nr:hypothetical protein BGX26_011728 [Mortierella sp. AD094]